MNREAWAAFVVRALPGRGGHGDEWAAYVVLSRDEAYHGITYQARPQGDGCP
jgi:hypothetical protein